MLLNKKDTSIVTLTLLLSIATSPVAWATSRWPSNASVADSTKLPESSLLSSKQVRTINLDQLPLNHHNEWDFKLKPMSTSEVVLLSQLDSPPPQPKLNHDTLVGQSSQVQQATISATEGEIPIWLWWLLPTLPILGFWIGLQLKAQRSKSANQLSNDSITPILSTQSDVPTQHTQIDSSPILGEEIKLPESTESLKTPLSSIVSSVSVPRTILRKRNQTDPELASVETRVIQEVTEAILIEEIDETEAETVIAEFKTINGEQGIEEIENRI